MKPDIDAISQFIIGTLLNNSVDAIQPDVDLLLSGMLDSLSVMRLVDWLQKSYDIRIPPEDVLVEHFGSINQMVAYLETKTAG